MKVSFLGAGLYGEALGKLAELNDHEVKYYDPYRFPEIKLSDAVSEAEAIVYVAPAEVYQELLSELPAEIPLILASKGFISLKPFEKFKDFSALGGAAFAEDIMEMKPKNGLPIFLTASSPLAAEIFTTDFVTIEYADDTKGIVLLGALKNVYAIGAGMMMDNKRPEEYLSLAYQEMREILEANGGNAETAGLSCGVPDLIISCTPDGRNYRFGLEIRRHPRSQIEPVGTVEGVTVISSLKKFPDFKIPEGLELFDKIVKKVKNATR